MSDYSDLIQSNFGRSNPVLPQVVGNIDEDPDRAQRAMDLAQATGVPSTAIYGDLDEFERQHKATVASDIVANNPHLADFVQSNPMVPKIANDDYGTLDAISDKIHNLRLGLRAGRMAETLFPGDPLQRWKDGGPLGSWLKTEDLVNYPVASAIAAGLGTPIELLLRGLGGAIQTTADVAEQIGGRDIGGLVEAEMMGLTGRHGVAPHIEAYQRAKPWVENAREPLPTTIPEYDAFRAKQNADDLGLLKEATSEAQQSLLRERNPDLFRDFIASHTDAEISVPGEMVAALYGDKVPAPDDGVLGWVPGIQDKLDLARTAGGDVTIPLADWLAKAEPELMQTLHDDIRVRPGGITARESALAAETEPRVPLPGAVPAVRAASALDPMFSIGDRRLKLERLKGAEPMTGEQLATTAGHDWASMSPQARQFFDEEAADATRRQRFGPEQGFHDFSINDEKGNPVGTVNLSEQKGGKHLYIEMVNGINGLGPRDFGPVLMKSILMQLRQEFPNAETIGGYRVSGAREKAGTMGEITVKLDAQDPKAVDAFGRMLEGGQWEAYSPKTQAYIKPYAERTLEDRRLIDAINTELDRIVPSKVAVQEAESIKAEGVQRAGGIYIRYRDTYPIILYALDGDNALGAARHEAIHHLRNYGFFDKAEWSTLERAAKDNGWLDKFEINRKYSGLDYASKLEESIAEAYRTWAEGADAPSPEVHGIFEKLKAFLTALKERIATVLGKEPTWEDVFRKVDTGEVGAREGTRPLDARSFDEKLSVAEPPEGGSRVFERAKALGVSKDAFNKYDKAVQREYQADLEAATKRAIEQQTREQTRQWKEDRKALRQEVAADIRGRPDVAADLFFGSGELYGKKVPLASVRLDADALTAEQKAALPGNYYGKNGLHPDAVAGLFGYGSGDALVERLALYTAARQAAGMSARDFVSRVIDTETDRQMHVKYGVLENNIVDAAKAQATGEVAQDRLHAELEMMAEKLGVTLDDRGKTLQQLRDKVAQMPIGSLSSDAYLRAAGRIGRQIESGLLDAQSHEAFAARLQQYYATIVANEASKLEGEIAKFEIVAKRFSKREVPTIDPAYTNFIHDILLRVGRPVRRSIQDLETEIGAGEYKTLRDFVEGKNGFYLREVAVADVLLDPGFRKAFDDLTVDEFRAVDTSIKSLIKNGRDEKKITKAGAEEDLDVVRKQMIDQLREFQEKTYDAKGGRWMGPIPPKIAKVLRTYGAAHIQMENLFNRWDHDNPQGVFQQYVMRDLVDAANNESAMEKRYAARLKDIDDKADLKKLVDNQIFKIPNSDQTFTMTRGNLRTIMLNAGNKSNLNKLALGYKLKPEQVLAWIDRHATKEDWDWAQKMGDIFADLKKEADVMYRNISGVAPESLPLEPITTPHGQYPGWYYPLIAHPEFEGPSKRMMGKDALEQDGFVRATTANGYTKSRTGATYPLALDLDMLAPRMKQMIHDIAMRPSVLNASKIFYDKDIRGAISKHFGNEWRDMLVPYLVDVANSANYMPKQQRVFTGVSEFIRQNMISTLVGLNPGTVLKHGPTALVQSLHEVGTTDFLKAMKSLFSINERTGETNWQYAIKSSEELQRRHQNYVETLGGATDLLQPTSGYASLRSTIQRLSAKPVAMSDLLSAVPTWLAQYEKTIGEGQTHGDAVYMADRAVRRAHGSVAITNRSGVMRGGAMAQWFASVYGFFNHIMNRQYEMLWKAGEAIGDAKAGNYREAMQRAPELTSMLFAYVLAPALIEEMVTPLISDDHDSWGKKAAKGVAFTLGASWVGVRDIANAILNGRDPSVGLMSTTFKTITDPLRDLNKKAPFSKEHAGKLVKDGATLMGALSGVVPGQVGRAAEFGLGVEQGTERPKGPWGWLTGARYGTLKGHPGTFQEWQRHHLGIR